jgi:hypothetical protein
MSLSSSERVRRALIVCCHFARNLTYYRAGWNKNGLLVEIDFWKGINGNCLDIAVLEWCKLFADRRDPHHWLNIIKDIDTFRYGLFGLVGGEEYFDAYINKVKIYRDKFVAHLDSGNAGIRAG